MAKRAVLDTSALLALLFNEPGAKKALDDGKNGSISTVSYSEALAKSLDRSVPLETLQVALAGMKLTMLPFDTECALAAASLRPQTRQLNFSFADRACLATALLGGLPVLTADRAWAECDLGIDVILIR